MLSNITFRFLKLIFLPTFPLESVTGAAALEDSKSLTVCSNFSK